MINFDVGEKFSKYPGGRKIAHGPHSGEELLLGHLVPLWEEFSTKQERIRMDFTFCMGATIGFMDSSFGDLAAIFGKEEVLRRFDIIGKHIVEEEIDGVLNRATKTCKFPTPELDKVEATKEQRQNVQDFMEWCAEQEPRLTLHSRTEDELYEVDWQKYCTQWCEIDEEKMEQEKMLILARQREYNDLFDRSKKFLKGKR